MADATIRAATVDDLAGILALWSVARSAHAVTEDRDGDLVRLLSDHPGSLIVATDADAVIGVVVAAWDGWRGSFYRLAVDPARRREGIGRRLVAAGERHITELGARRATALVAHDDTRAGGFWDALGYPLDTAIGRRVRSL